MEIYKEFMFEAAHRLPRVPPGHKCARLHGHSWKGGIYVAGEIDPEFGWIMDYGEIKKLFAALFDQLDHNYLNDIEGLENPTSEVLVAWVWERLAPSLPQLRKLVLWENKRSRVEFCG